MAEIPDRYLPAWQRVVDEANRRKVAVEVRVAPGTETLDDGTTLRGSFVLLIRNRGGGEPTSLGTVPTFDQAIAELRTAIAAEPLPGADALREELRTFGQRLAMMTPRDVQKKRGADFRLYRDYRDRILPLAWDNLVDSVRLEALEAFVRKVGELPAAEAGAVRTPAELGAFLESISAEARGLVAPKETEVSSVEVEPTPEPPTNIQRPAARRRRKEPSDAAP